VPIPGEEKAIPASELATLAHQAGFTAHRADSVADALRQIGRIESQARVLICGSLYLAGTVLRANGEAVT